jgi:arylsulfatase
MRRLLVAAICALGLTGDTVRIGGEQPLNVVLFVIDDVRWDSIGAAGNKVVHTPQLDRLAREGVLFRQARVTTSICMVSRASLLTGQYMSRHGITAFGRALTPEAFANTYPAVLRGAGYWVGHVGKYDVGQPRLGVYDFLRAYHGVHWIESGGERVHVTEKNARDSLEFLQSRPKDRRFALAVGFFAAHAQDNAKEQYLPQDWSAAFYKGKPIPPPIHGNPRYKAALPPFLASEANEGRVRYHWRFDTPESYQAYVTRYYRLITEVDSAIGRIVDELKAQRAYENTLIVFIGDNGYFHADRGLADKWYPYEESIRVPLIVRDPRLPASRRGRTLDQLALNIDIAPTIVSAAGVPVPPGMQGDDLSPLYLRSRPPAWRDEFFYEHPTITSRDRIPSSHAVVRRDWKYVEWPEFDYRQLFNLKDDPGELRNLAADSAHAPAQRFRMQAALTAWRELAR